MRDFQNPFNRNTYPHLHLLIDLAIEKAEERKGDGFLKHFWKPYLKALGNWLRDFERDPGWNLRFVENGQIKRTSGRGKNTGITLKLPAQKDTCLQKPYSARL